MCVYLCERKRDEEGVGREIKTEEGGKYHFNIEKRSGTCVQ